MINWGQVVLGALGAGVATWFGAWAAFKHEHRAQLEKERYERAQAIKRALLVLLSQRTQLFNLRDQFLAPHEESPHRELMVPPIQLEDSPVQFALDPLLFVLDTDQADLLNQLLVYERRYRSIFAAIAVRSDGHRRLQELLGGAGATFSGRVEDIEQMVGKPLLASLNDLTNYLYTAVPRAIDEQARLFNEFNALGQREFPKSKFFSVDLNSGSDSRRRAA